MDSQNKVIRLIDVDEIINDIINGEISVEGDDGFAEEAVKCYQAVILKILYAQPIAATINMGAFKIGGNQ